MGIVIYNQKFREGGVQGSEIQKRKEKKAQSSNHLWAVLYPVGCSSMDSRDIKKNVRVTYGVFTFTEYLWSTSKVDTYTLLLSCTQVT